MVLGKTGAPIKSRAIIYKGVVQELLLYGSKRWVLMDIIMTMLDGFYSISIWISGMTEKKGDVGEWEWASGEVTLEVTGGFPIRE